MSNTLTSNIFLNEYSRKRESKCGEGVKVSNYLIRLLYSKLSHVLFFSETINRKYLEFNLDPSITDGSLRCDS